ncbi:MAG: DUF2914 domain-containing protein [Candidatus Paceibacterota bacterium]|jgi:hypothetical protein
MFVSIKKYIVKHERYVGIAAIAVGFIWDSLTLARPDQIFGNITLISYLLISAGGIIVLALRAKRNVIAPILWLALVQFSFGNLAGGFLVVYGRSGTFEGSYLFFLILGAFIIGNEFMRDKYSRVNFHISVWYFLLFSYLSLMVPMILSRMGDDVFLLSGVSSLAIVSVFILILRIISPDMMLAAMKNTIFSIAAIFTLLNGLYFLNIIPPVPLSLRGIGVYHGMEKTINGDYKAFFEKPDWYEFRRDTGKTFTILPGNRVAYCFSSVFAPVKLETGIYHVWEYYDGRAGEWRVSSVVSFPITGGRNNGYRGYSAKSSLASGKWRCSVKTESGALVGRTTFDVIYSTQPFSLSEKIL